MFYEFTRHFDPRYKLISLGSQLSSGPFVELMTEKFAVNVQSRVIMVIFDLFAGQVAVEEIFVDIVCRKKRAYIGRISHGFEITFARTSFSDVFFYEFCNLAR